MRCALADQNFLAEHVPGGLRQGNQGLAEHLSGLLNLLADKGQVRN